MLVLDELSRRTGRLVLMLRVMDMSGINMVRRHVHPPHLRVTAASAFRGSAASARAPPPLFVRAPRLRAVRRAAPRIRALCV